MYNYFCSYICLLSVFQWHLNIIQTSVAAQAATDGTYSHSNNGTTNY